ncbi:MAG: C10 family peptidase [Chitinophagaceae bacterium]
MRKNLLPVAGFFVLLIMIFIGCNKNQSANHPKQFTSIDLVPEEVAKTVAQKFSPNTFFPKNDATAPTQIASLLNGNNQIKNQFIIKDASGNPAFYVFNFADNAGFLFVSGDYKIQPILGFVEHGEFKKDAVPATYIEWGNKTVENVEIVRQQLYDNSRLANASWKDYFKKTGITGITPSVAGKYPPPDPGCQETTNSVIVGPLLPVTWGQGCSYNDLCPSASCTNICAFTTNAWTGCVATSMAQVIRYWSPANGYGYNYASMPTGSGNGEVQRLMRDAGSTVGMSYGCSGSGANGGNVPGALTGSFGFTSANRHSYGGSTYSQVQSNLSYHWPVLLEGCSSRTNVFLGIYYTYSDCHEWVCDGYIATDYTWCNPDGTQGGAGYLSFHMNWGWHETWGGNDYNGWFAFNNWNISGAGLNFQYAQDCVTEIHP